MGSSYRIGQCSASICILLAQVLKDTYLRSSEQIAPAQAPPPLPHIRTHTRGYLPIYFCSRLQDVGQGMSPSAHCDVARALGALVEQRTGWFFIL